MHSKLHRVYKANDFKMRNEQIFLILAFFFTVALGLTCKTCDSSMTCPELPVNNCEPVHRPCSCCKECARNIGETCSGSTTRCATGLMCVNANGEALTSVPWFMTNYEGTCQNVVIQPIVVENTKVKERRNRI